MTLALKIESTRRSSAVRQRQDMPIGDLVEQGHRMQRAGRTSQDQPADQGPVAGVRQLPQCLKNFGIGRVIKVLFLKQQIAAVVETTPEFFTFHRQAVNREVNGQVREPVDFRRKDSLPLACGCW